MTGRPSSFTQEIADEICERLVEGESLRKICRDDHTPNVATVCRWLASNEGFREHYAHARALQADTLADEILDIADDASLDTKIVGEDEREVCNTEFVQRSKLRIDSRKWLAGKMAPKKYGDYQTVDLNANHTMSEEMQAWLDQRS
jgi:hypothetical protein